MMARRPRDNWLILVTAVVKKQQFLELCRAESNSSSLRTESSAISSLVSLSSPFNSVAFDYYSDLSCFGDKFTSSPIKPALRTTSPIKPTLRTSPITPAPKTSSPITVMLKLALHCQCCAERVRRVVSQFEGVEKVETDWNASIMAVTGNIDPKWIRNKVQDRTPGKVELLNIEFNDMEVKERKAEETVIWIKMDCEECERKMQTSIEGLRGVTHISVEGRRGVTSVDVSQQNKLTVIGYVDPEKAAHRTGRREWQLPYNNVVTHHVSEKEIIKTHNRFFQQPNEDTAPDSHYNQEYGLQMYHHHQKQDYPYLNTLPPPPPQQSFQDIFSDENPNGCFVM